MDVEYFISRMGLKNADDLHPVRPRGEGRILPLWCFFASSRRTENATPLKLGDN